MVQKKRISEEAFPWVKSTSGDKTKEPKKNTAERNSLPAKKMAGRALGNKAVEAVSQDSKEASVLGTSVPSVFVLYDKNGNILSVAKVNRKYLPEGKMPFNATEDTFATELALPDEFHDNSIKEIHQLGIVRGIDSKPYLAKK